MSFVKLWQNIDTLKYHLYPSSLITSQDVTGYNALIDKLLSLKLEAQSNRNENKNTNSFQFPFKKSNFRVRPSTVKGFSVSIENADITIHLKKLVVTADQSPFSKVEFRASFLQRYGYMKAVQECNKFLKECIMSAFIIKISEIHLHCDIQGYNFTVLDFSRIKARSRNNRFYDESFQEARFYSGRSFQGFMLGGGDYLMRVYNKTKEIKKFPNKSFIESLWKTNKDYDPTKEVFRIEFQLRREKLKQMVINDCVLDGFEVILNNLNNIWKKCLDDFSLRDLDNNKAIALNLGGRFDKEDNLIELSSNTVNSWFTRSNIHPLWRAIASFNGHYANDVIETFTKPFTNNFLYVHNAFKAFLSTSLAHYGSLYPSIIEDAMTKIRDYTFKKHDKTVLEDVYSKHLDRFKKLEITYPDDEIHCLTRHEVVNNLLYTIENTYNALHDDGVGYNDKFKEKLSQCYGA